MIDPGERVITIEDAAELRLQQPHWLPLETRPPNLEGQGAITIRDLVINALRMRPDRIILGEIRGPECFDLLAAMNTGHDGSCATLHSNSPRECLARMENMVMMSDIKVPKEAISRQIADSVDLIIQVKRLRDGSRRTTNITEVIGMEGDVIVTQELFKFEYLDESPDGKIIGEYRSMGLRPYTMEKAKQFGFDQLPDVKTLATDGRMLAKGVLSMFGVEMVMESRDIKTEAAASDLFEIPKDYREVPPPGGRSGLTPAPIR